MRRGLLLGAGFSYDLGMPLASEVTETFLCAVTPEGARRLGQILSSQDPYGEGRPINADAIHDGIELLIDFKNSKGTNYEAFMANLEIAGYGHGQSQAHRDSYHFLFRVFYDQLFKIPFAYQAASYEIHYERNKGQFASLQDLVSTGEMWVFSLNHDLYLECLALDYGIPLTYGDSDTIIFPLNNVNPERKIEFTYSQQNSLTKAAPAWHAGSRGINLVRLHGGLSEHHYKDRLLICNPSLSKPNSRELIAQALAIESMGYYVNGRRTPSGRDRFVTGPDGHLDILERTVLTGGRKYSKTTNAKKGEEKLKLFSEVLADLDEILVIGYSFGDVHINNRLLNAMVLNDRLHLWIVDPTSRPFPAFLEQFNYDLRLRSATCRAAEWLAYLRNEKWDISISEELKRNTPLRAEVQKAVHAMLRIRPAPSSP